MQTQVIYVGLRSSLGGYAARLKVTLADTPSAPSTRSIKSVEISLVCRFMIAVIRERDVPDAAATCA